MSTSRSSNLVNADVSPGPVALPHRWQFSLRSLMVATTVCAVAASLMRTHVGEIVLSIVAFTILPPIILFAAALGCIRIGERLQLSPNGFRAWAGLLSTAIGAILMYVSLIAAMVGIVMCVLALSLAFG